jgi:hypothetical protein
VTQRRDELRPEKAERLREFMESGGQVVGQAAGAALSIVAGPVVGTGAGAALGEVFARVGLEIHERLLARRQGARAAGALDVAFVRVDERLNAGDDLRDDGFFNPGPDGRVDAEEVLEGTLLTAANAYEERKVALIGKLYANLAFEPTVSPALANFLLRLADRLTYHQLTVLAFFAYAQSGEGEMALVRLTAEQSETGRLPSQGLIAELNDLSEVTRVLGLRQDDGTVIAPQDAWGDGGWLMRHFVQVALTPVGDTLHRLMELDKLPPADLDSVLAELSGQ